MDVPGSRAGKKREPSSRLRRAAALAACFGVAAFALTQAPPAVQDVALYQLMPHRLVSRAFGTMASVPLPPLIRSLVYNGWAIAFDANLDEADRPLEEYRTLREFFARQLKPGLRNVEDAGRGGVVSPVDGRVLSLGSTITNAREVCFEAKGKKYSLEGLLQSGLEEFNLQDEGIEVHYLVLYLAPGDYHRIHAPCSWTVRRRTWIPGELRPVNERAVERVPGLYVENERVVLQGDCETGTCALAAIGALNVGSIGITLEPELLTNQPFSIAARGTGHVKVYNNGNGVLVEAGREVASFNLGSTVVLVYTTRKKDGHVQFLVSPGDRVRMGQVLTRQET